MTFVMVVLAVVGTRLNIAKDPRGFVFWAVSNGYLCYHNAMIGERWQAALFGLYFVWAIEGYLKWRRA